MVAVRELQPLEWIVGAWDAETDANGATGGSRFTLEAGGQALSR